MGWMVYQRELLLMDRYHLTEMCNKLNLPLPINKPTRVEGGLLHSMWKLDINNCSYAVKQLSKDIKLTEEVKNNYELTEMIAYRFSQKNIPAISAMEIAGKHLLEISGTAFLIYPWVHAQTLDKKTISEEQAVKVATLVASLHLINLDVPELSEPTFDTHTSEKINSMIDKAIANRCVFAEDLKNNRERILAINEEFHKNIPVLQQTTVVSHGDLDQKNILWNAHNAPFLIDWESARKLNPMYEIIDVSLNWSGITTDNFNEALFIKMLEVYEQAGAGLNTNHIQAAFYAVLGNWINWLVYNIERACNNDPENIDQQRIGIEQVQQVIPTLFRLEMLMPHLIKLMRKTQ